MNSNKLERLAEWIRSHGNRADIQADGSIRIISDGRTYGADCSFIDYVRTPKEAEDVLGY